MSKTDDAVRLLAPFDPIVWDRRRFEAFWGWPYRFEAYTPAAKRQYGYYALPLLWRDAVIGWANVISKAGALQTDFGYVAGRRPRGRAFTIALEAELARMRSSWRVSRLHQVRWRLRLELQRFARERVSEHHPVRVKPVAAVARQRRGFCAWHAAESIKGIAERGWSACAR